MAYFDYPRQVPWWNADLTGDPGGDGVTDLTGRAYGAAAVGEVGLDCGLHLAGRLLVAQVVEQHRDREDRGGGICLALPGDVRRAAVDRLEHRRRRTVRVDV